VAERQNVEPARAANRESNREALRRVQRLEPERRVSSGKPVSGGAKPDRSTRGEQALRVRGRAGRKARPGEGRQRGRRRHAPYTARVAAGLELGLRVADTNAYGLGDRARIR